MTQLKLPPKRWQDAEDSQFDSIRFKSWFERLLKRKHHIPLLREAYRAMQSDKDLTQFAACAVFNVDERELRDYIKFHQLTGINATVDEQYCIDVAYKNYCHNHANLSFTEEMRMAATACHLDPRSMKEKWEIDPNYYPTNYE